MEKYKEIFIVLLTINALALPIILLTLNVFKNLEDTPEVKKYYKRSFRAVLFSLNGINLAILVCFLLEETKFIMNFITIIKNAIQITEIAVIISLFFYISAMLNIVFSEKK